MIRANRLRYAFAIALATTLAVVCCGMPSASVRFAGDRGASEAKILVDDVEVGRLPGVATKSADSTEMVVEMYARIGLGPHRVTAITTAGDTIHGQFESHESADVHVKSSARLIKSYRGG